jgi:hypothetical protein
MGDAAYILSGHRQMVDSDLQGGTANFGAFTSPCTVGVFDLENPLLAEGGGHSPRLMGVIEVADEDLPESGFPFSTGQPVTITDGTETPRACKVESWRNLGPLWQVTVVDLSQGA